MNDTEKSRRQSAFEESEALVEAKFPDCCRSEDPADHNLLVRMLNVTKKLRPKERLVLIEVAAKKNSPPDMEITLEEGVPEA